MEERLRKAGTRVRITGQLIESLSGRHVWADKLDRALDDIFDLQDRITQSVVAAIEPSLRFAEIEHARAKPTIASMPTISICKPFLVAPPCHALASGKRSTFCTGPSNLIRAMPLRWHMPLSP